MSLSHAEAQIASAPLIDDYRPSAGQFDEMRAGDGSLRAHWGYLIEALRALGREGIDSRWQAS